MYPRVMTGSPAMKRILASPFLLEFTFFFLGPGCADDVRPRLSARLQPTSIFPHEAPDTGSCGSFVGENAASRLLDASFRASLLRDFGTTSRFELAASHRGRKPNRWLATTFYPCRRCCVLPRPAKHLNLCSLQAIRRSLDRDDPSAQRPSSRATR